MSQQNKRPSQTARPNSIIHAQSFSGPLPHPDVLAGFENVQPGAADRIIKMAENEAAHRHSIERSGQRSFIMSERIGMFCALLICFLALGGGFYCILKGHPIAGTVTTSTPIAVIAAIFIQGKK